MVTGDIRKGKRDYVYPTHYNKNYRVAVVQIFLKFSTFVLLKIYGETACSKNTFESKLRLMVPLRHPVSNPQPYVAQNSQRYER